MKILQRKCKSCNKQYFAFFSQFDLLSGRELICKECNTKYVAKAPWVFLFNILITIAPIIYILVILFFGLLFGSILSIVGSILISGVIVYLVPIEKVK